MEIENFIKTRCESKNISCKSIVVTVFGDLVSQHGGWIWLGSLIQALMPLGYSERLIRTSVFRLVQDDWLRVEKVGRKSFYAFTESAEQQYTKAARRIYANSTPHTDDKWLIVIPSFVPDSKMQAFKRQLRWLGFSSLAQGTLAHPSIDKKSLEETLCEMGLTDKVIVFDSHTSDSSSETVLKKLVEQRWNLDELQEEYQEFVQTYQFLGESELNTEVVSLNQEQQFQIRTLLIHEFRRILLKDHQLPKSMWPEDWSGELAYQTVSRIYQRLSRQSCHFAMQEFENQSGKLLPAIESFNARFKER